MRTATELVGLLSETIVLWTRFFTPMGAWFCAGFALSTGGTYASAALGSDYDFAATTVFVVGLIASVIALVMMIHPPGRRPPGPVACEPGLRTPQELSADQVGEPDVQVPIQIFLRESRLEVLASAVGPFLAVYVVWGLVDEQVRELFFANIVLQGTGGAATWSVRLDRIAFYGLLAAVAWVASQVSTRLARKTQSRWLLILQVLLEGLWVFSSFVALLAVGQRFVDWLSTRVFWAEITNAWRSVLDALPLIELPFDLTIAAAIRQAVSWFADTLLPGVAMAVLLPLMWLALTATVFGWREFTARQIVSGTRVSTHLDRAQSRLTAREHVAAWQVGGGLLSFLTSDLRTKYLPVAHSLRLILRSGPRFLGAYLVLVTALDVAHDYAFVMVDLTVGPQPADVSLLIMPFSTLLVDLIFTTLLIALYVAAFDRGLAGAVRSQLAPAAPVSAPELDHLTVGGQPDAQDHPVCDRLRNLEHSGDA